MSAPLRAARVEARKLLSSRALPALAACAALLAALTMSSPAEFPGGPLLMTAASLSFSPMSGASKGQSPQSVYQTCVPPREFFLQ